MAKVEIDISEFDLLRDGKKQAENKIKDLQKEIEEYKSKSRVIIRNRSDNSIIKSFIQYIGDEIHKYGSSDTKRLLFLIKQCESSFLTLPQFHSSEQYVGFDDVEQEVKNYYNQTYKSQLDADRDNLKVKEAKLNERLSGLDKKYLELHKEELDKKDKYFEAIIVELKKTLNEKDLIIKEATKSHEDRLAEALENFNSAQKELAKYQKKTSIFKFLKNIFKKKLR